MASSYTIDIFSYIVDRLPPLVPKKLQEDAVHAIERLRESNFSQEEIESLVVFHAKRLWPYRQAFRELLSRYEEKMGLAFLHAHVPAFLQRRSNEFAAHGGTLEHLRQNPPPSFFSQEERTMLRHAFLNTATDLALHAAQAALSVHRHHYEAMIERHMGVLSFIEEQLAKLHRMAEREEADMPDLTHEIRSHIRAIEHGLSALGPPYGLHDIRQSVEHFEGRKQEKKMRV